MRRFKIRDKALSIGRERYETDGSADDPGLGAQELTRAVLTK